MISDSRVKVRMGVYTASGWTELATLFIERDQKTSPRIDYEPVLGLARDESSHWPADFTNKGEALAQIRVEMEAMEDDVKPPHLSNFWRNGVLANILKTTKRWAAEKEEQLSWMKDMKAFEIGSVVGPTDNTRRFASYGHGPITLFGTASHAWGSH